MKHAAAITIALLLAATAHAMPRHILITINEATYANAPKPEKAHKAAEKYIDAPSIFGHTHNGWADAAGNVYGVTLHWAEQWTKHADKLDNPAKLAQLNAKLAEAGVAMIPCDDYAQALADAGLTRVAVSTTGSTTTTVSTTTTTTTRYGE
jgi:hypothetical protein